MKVLIKIIISLFFLFWIVTPSFSQNRWYIENILDLNYWIEVLEISKINTHNYYFNNYQTYRIYNAFKATSRVLKNEIIRKYRDNTIWYYQMKWLITNYTNFIYYTNKYFFFMKQKEIYSNDKIINNAIIDNLTQAKSYYMRMKFLILR